MHIEKTTIIKENKFGDRCVIEKEDYVYDNEYERLEALRYNKERKHSDTYIERWRKSMDSTVHAATSQLMDSIDEYFDMLNSFNNF